MYQCAWCFFVLPVKRNLQPATRGCVSVLFLVFASLCWRNPMRLFFLFFIIYFIYIYYIYTYKYIIFNILD